MSAAIDFTYQYAFPSGMHVANNKPRFSLATCDANFATPYFFDGRVRSPKIMGDMLFTLSEVVRTHFFLPQPALLDPVLTSNENLLRLEGFSGCCGVYARVDLPSQAFEGECHGRGTTNVDFNTPMRNALLRMRDNEDVHFSVGKDEVSLRKGDNKIIEKKVKLPLRWIKGFSEVQAYQPSLSLKMEISAVEALRFVRSLPKASKPKMSSYVVCSGKAIRLTHRPQKGAISFQGTHRVKIIEPLLVRANKLRIWYNEDDRTSAWEVCFPIGSFFLMISPEVFRGFSGEGQVLSDLAKSSSDELIAQTRAQLKWQSEIDISALAKALKKDKEDIKTALSVLGTRGLAGFDVTTGHYFHRELPFDLSKVEDMQPRLKNARKIVASGKVTLIESDKNKTIYQLPGTGTMHRVQLKDSGDTCTCPWFSKYLGKRGPCKHILAAQIINAENHEK